ncbi:MAG TPA: serine/threonine-protein kinase [Kofleriaceae bacterium]|nr:serine/threonine-protein kinase [Kofleriaceae bacterium]
MASRSERMAAVTPPADALMTTAPQETRSSPGAQSPGAQSPGAQSSGAQSSPGTSSSPGSSSSGSSSSPGASSSPGSPAASGDPKDSLVGTVLENRYEIIRKIGQGGMGAVYEANHKLIGKRMAVKVLLDKYAQKDQIVARLEQEARLASQTRHPNIIDITDFGQTADGRTFVVMEFLEGESLASLISRGGRLEIGRAVHIARQVAGALGAAHEKSIVHRDIKPENIFLVQRGDDDFVKVVDFGISKSIRPEQDGEESPRLTQTGMVLGTPLYMSPEQARGDEQLDSRIDIYALGVILYEMVTAEVPFRGTNYLNILSQVLADEATPPSQLNPEVSPDLEAVILKAMEKDRDERYQTMEEMDADLMVLQSDSMTATGARLTANRRRRRAARRSALRGLRWVGVAIVAAAAIITVRGVMGGGEQGAGGAVVPPPPAPVATGTAAPAPPAQAAAALPASPPPRPAVDEATIQIESTPSGVEVYEGDRQLGTTPFEWRGERANRAIVLTGEKLGYDYATITINPYFDNGKPAVLRLKRARSGTGKRPNRPGHEQAAPQPPARDDTAGGDLTGSPYKPK